MNWEEIRSQYPAAERHTYLNSASSGLISLKTKQALEDHFQDFLLNGGMHRPQWVNEGKSAKELACNLLGCQLNELGFITDVSSGMNLAAERLDPNLEVVLIKGDFPSVGLPWIARGFKINWIEMEEDGSISIDKINDQLKKSRQILSISWVQYSNGFTIDLQQLSEVCSANNAIMVIDGTQGVGNIPISLKDLSVDIFMASSFKWQTGGYGIGLYYENSKSEFKSTTKSIGWNSLKEFGPRLKAENYKDTTEIIEAGHPKYVSLVTLNAALTQLNNIGWNNIYNKVSQMKDQLYQSIINSGLTPIYFSEADNQAPIISVLNENNAFKKLKDKGIIVTRREDYIRLSVHFYNNESDLSKLEAAITA